MAMEDTGHIDSGHHLTQEDVGEQDEQAVFARARKNVQTLHRARKLDKQL